MNTGVLDSTKAYAWGIIQVINQRTSISFKFGSLIWVLKKLSLSYSLQLHEPSLPHPESLRRKQLLPVL